jgi:transposase InsO family protein
MDERISFIAAYLRGEEAMTVLCESYGISRKTGYKWVGRYLSDGAAGLEDRSRAPRRHGRRMAPELAEAILALRRDRPYWGPRKLRAILARKAPSVTWPAASTIGDLLRAHGLSEPRRRRRRALPAGQPFLEVTAPNDVWCIDFKGWFRTGDGRRCDPLTITDADSRFLLVCQIVDPRTEPVRAVVEEAFHTHGLPRAMRSDNGAPFASTGAGGLSRLSLDWVKAGIALERIEPGKPQQNGRHERMHRTLKAETSRPPAASLAEQQARFDAFRHDFNHYRPHEALGQQPPADFYRPSPRPWPDSLAQPWYDADHAERRVRSNGEIKWGGNFIFISEVLAGEPVGVAETQTGDWIVRYANIDLGVIDKKTSNFRRFSAARPGRPEAKHKQNTVTHVSGQ